MKQLLIGIFICSSLGGYGQTYLGESILPIIEENGFHKIPLSPANTSLLSENYSNLRITDEANRQVPYILETETEFTENEFSEYRILEKVQEVGCCTKVIFEGHKDRPINNIHIRIKNADVLKTASLSGSDDLEKWFALKDVFYFDRVNNTQSTSELRVLDFPLSNYKYYLLRIDDSTTAQLNILALGYYNVFKKSASYYTLGNYRMTISDSLKQKKTFIRITSDSVHWVDRLDIRGFGTPYFLRRATLYSVEQKVNKKGKTEEYNNHLATFDITHEKSASVEVPNIQLKTILLVIDNDDNPPLKNYSVDILQLKRYAVAWLEKGKIYSLKLGEPGLESPKYDLGLFKSKIPSAIVLLKPSHFQLFEKKTPPRESEGFYQTKYLVWVSIIGIIVVLGFMSFKMIRESNLSNKT
jgi:hypothetical protein